MHAFGYADAEFALLGKVSAAEAPHTQQLALGIFGGKRAFALVVEVAEAGKRALAERFHMRHKAALAAFFR